MAEQADAITPYAHRVPDLATRLNLSRAHAYQLVADGRIPSVRIGRSVRVLHTDLMAFLEANRTAA